MLKPCWMIGVVVLALLSAIAQDDKPKPQLSQDALTADQIAVYRAVLTKYTGKGKDPALNIADTTDVLDFSDEWSGDKTCFRGLALERQPQPPVIHRLSPEIFVGSRMKLVDAEQQAKIVERNDPSTAIRQGLANDEAVRAKQIDKLVDQAFATGLFSFSEIVFDKQHRFAVIQYGFVCGSLCGHGNIVVLKKSGKAWKVHKVCGGWIS